MAKVKCRSWDVGRHWDRQPCSRRGMRLGKGRRSSSHSVLPQGSQARVELGREWGLHGSAPLATLGDTRVSAMVLLSFLLHSFPVTVVEIATNWVALKIKKFIFSQFLRPKIWNQGVSRAMLSLEAPREKPLLAHGGFWHLLTVAASLCSLPPSSMASSVCLCYLLSCLLEGHLSLYVGPTWGICNGLISRTLITSAKSLFPQGVTLTHSRGLSVDISSGATIAFTIPSFLLPTIEFS